MLLGRVEMEVGSAGGEAGTHWWWAVASAVQLGWAITSYRKGYAGDSHLMPFKAFAVASLFVGASTSAGISCLQGFGIHKVEDVMEVGANLRTRLGILQKTPNEKTDDL